MYKDLPKKLQKEVKELLNSNQFNKAKAVHDAWIIEKKIIND